MPWLPMEWPRRAGSPQHPSEIPLGLRLAGTVLRDVFIACLLVLTLRVSMPQNETVWTAYDTPSDLIRMALGCAVCIFIALQLFRAPRDAQGYRVWLYFGFVGIAFALICIAAVW